MRNGILEFYLNVMKLNVNSCVWLVVSPAIDGNPERVQAGVTSELS